MEGAADPDTPVLERTATDRAAALARLLHRECTRLLELYKERENFLSHHVPGDERLVTFALCPEALTTAEQVGHVRSALRRCMELLECLITREVEEMGEELEGEYESLRKTVKDRLSDLVHSTAALLENGEGGCPPSPPLQCTEGQDEVEGSGSFAAKLWNYRVLLELIHWSDSASQTLHLFHSEKQGQQQQQLL
ncbi:IL-6 subfamily member ciliary neurotrophic factor-like protein [Labeo rohita]|uniref:IL-6 subfamily member ciliary neurotrophic factor-like protein n=1 Tax=Labeo rohita TaxID=84645 RepID=A0A498NC58_LABRO|nr:IL-6 subfamily member ciliary neurotrophic factor-like protein [Labeo rohita]